jgi:hypothetical protein
VRAATTQERSGDRHQQRRDAAREQRRQCGEMGFPPRRGLTMDVAENVSLAGRCRTIRLLVRKLLRLCQRRQIAGLQRMAAPCKAHSPFLFTRAGAVPESAREVRVGSTKARDRGGRRPPFGSEHNKSRCRFRSGLVAHAWDDVARQKQSPKGADKKLSGGARLCIEI